MEQALAETLHRLGLQVAFGVTGSGSSWRLISALESLGASYFPATHEAAAAIMAGGAFRATGRLAAAIGIKGPGLANMLGGIAFNHFEDLPVASVCESYGEKTPAYRMHKRLDQAALLAPLCKGSVPLGRAVDQVPKLFDVAQQEVPGPFHIDLSDSETPAVSWRAPEPITPAIAARDTAHRLLDGSKRPIVIAGSLAMRRSWGSRLQALRLPVFTTAAAKGLVDEAGPFSLGVYTGDGKSRAPEAIAFDECDLVVGIGLRNIEILSPKSFTRPLVVIDAADANLSAGFGAQATWRTDDPADYASVLAALEHKAWGDHLATRAKARLFSDSADVWLPPACFQALNSLSYAYSLAVDTGSFCTIAEHAWLAGPDRRFFGSSNGRSMGGALPTAIGAAAADAATPMFCVMGDGGLRMYVAEIALAVQRRLAICFVLMADGYYGSVAAAASAPGLSQTAIEIPGSSWTQAVEEMGCEAVTVGTVEAFSAAIRAWNRTGPLYIECRFPAEPYRNMTRDLR